MNKILIAIISISLFTTSCNKNKKAQVPETKQASQSTNNSASRIITNTQDVFVSNGILNFSTLEVYETFLQNFENKSLEEKNEWISNFNFSSLHSTGIPTETERLF